MSEGRREMNLPSLIVIDGSDDETLEEKPAIPLNEEQEERVMYSSGTLHPEHGKRRKKSETTEPPATSLRQLSLPPTVMPPADAEPSPPRYMRAQWPNHVAHVRSNFNPDGIVLPFAKNYGSCGCETVCRHGTCRNAKLGVFCTSGCCPFNGTCGNGLVESSDLVLVFDNRNKALAVLATKPIPKGVVLGQYLGRLTLEPPRKDRVRNRGYRLVMKCAPRHCGSWRACIDADGFGTLLRFVNHSCEPTAQFHHVANRFTHTVVVVTARHVRAGEEITAGYGDVLWFICNGGRRTCCHKGITGPTDP